MLGGTILESDDGLNWKAPSVNQRLELQSSIRFRDQ